MYNTTFTSTTPLETDSYLNEPEAPKVNKKEEEAHAYPEESLLNTSSQLSIEVMRNHIRLALKDYEFETSLDEVDFLLQNYEVFRLLPSLGQYLKKYFGPQSKLTLELLNEGPQWQTLFINIYTTCEWERSRTFVNRFLDDMFDLYPRVAEKLNVNINPDGV
jgi:hypothetical protein